MIKRLIKEPIVHFLIAGALLYVVAYWVRGPELFQDDENTIVVDRDSMLEFMQFRANAFDPESFSETLDAMSEVELASHINAFIEEEVLFLEAKSLNLDDSDYIIRQRMVQKMNFLLSDLAGGESEIDESELKQYFQDNITAFRIKPSVTFTHVYFDDQKRGEEQALADAQALKERLNENNTGFNDANDEGDRFHFLRNYVERTVDYVAGHFGSEFAQGIEALEATSDQWQGPIHSVFGYHVVLMTDYQEGGDSTLELVRADVERDFIRERNERLLEEITDNVKQRYNVAVEEIRAESVQ